MQVAFTAWNRPGYLAEVMESWQNVRGVDNAMFDFHLEPGCPQTEEVIWECSPAPTCVHNNDQVMGVFANPFLAIDCRFENGFLVQKPDDFVILAEDDMVVATDILEYFEWASKTYASDSRAIAVSATQFECQGATNEILLLQGWTGWVWGTWRDRWENFLKPTWQFNYQNKGWDWFIIEYWCGLRGWSTVVPAVSRSQHIGKFGGVHTDSNTAEAHQSKCFSHSVPPQLYTKKQPDEPVKLPCHHTGT